MKFWNLKKNENTEQAARLDLFGVIGADGFWVDGFDDISFKNEMASIPEDKALDIYINSDGGSVFTAIAIYNMIARHKGKVTITVAGIAASAATIITSAPNASVVMPVGSMLMVHAPSIYAGQLNAKEMRELADTLDKVGGSIVDIYKKKAPGLSDEKIVEMMSGDTYLTAAEAVELGLADTVDSSLQIAAVRDNGQLMVNGLAISAERLKNIPAAWAGEEEKGVKPMTFEELKEQYPDFYNQAKEEGKQEGFANGEQAERERIKAIEEMALQGHEALLAVAKFEKPVKPETFAITLLKAEKEKKSEYLANRQADAKELDEVGAGDNKGIDPKAEQKAAEQAELDAIIAAGKRGFVARKK